MNEDNTISNLKMNSDFVTMSQLHTGNWTSLDLKYNINMFSNDYYNDWMTGPQINTTNMPKNMKKTKIGKDSQRLGEIG